MHLEIDDVVEKKLIYNFEQKNNQSC